MSAATCPKLTLLGLAIAKVLVGNWSAPLAPDNYEDLKASPPGNIPSMTPKTTVLKDLMSR